jgi:hypothetical protein
MSDAEINILLQEHAAYKKLYESLTDFGQDKKLPVEKLDFVKARLFDTSVLVNRISRGESEKFNSKKFWEDYSKTFLKKILSVRDSILLELQSKPGSLPNIPVKSAE